MHVVMTTHNNQTQWQQHTAQTTGDAHRWKQKREKNHKSIIRINIHAKVYYAYILNVNNQIIMSYLTTLPLHTNAHVLRANVR